MIPAEQFSVQYAQLGNGTRRTRCQSFILVIVAIAVIAAVVIALAVPLGVISSRSSTNAGYQTVTAGSQCTTRECIKLASSVLSAIDDSADPCTDFYQFSCGNWLENAVIPPCEYCDACQMYSVKLIIPRNELNRVRYPRAVRKGAINFNKVLYI